MSYVKQAKASNDLIVYETDAHGKIVDANSHFCNFTGYDKHEVVGKHHSEIRADISHAQFLQDLKEHARLGKAWHGEVKNKTKSGDVRVVNATIYPYIDELGETRFLSCKRKA